MICIPCFLTMREQIKCKVKYMKCPICKRSCIVYRQPKPKSSYFVFNGLLVVDWSIIVRLEDYFDFEGKYRS